MPADALNLLRIYVDGRAQEDGQPYWRVLLARASSMGVRNAAVLRVLDSFGAEAVVHGSKATDLAPGERLILELSDAEPVLRKFIASLPVTDDIGLATLETITLARYGGHRHG